MSGVKSGATDEPLLQVRDLRIGYDSPQGRRQALRGVDFDLVAGETLGIVGESGSGKSQTALALPGLLPRSAQVQGSVRFDGVELLGRSESELNQIRGKRIAMVFQDPMSSLNPYLSIGTQMAETLRWHQGLSRAAALAECARMLDAVRIANAPLRLRQYPHELSGGMRQRVLIAAALLCRPALLIADEPTTALDVTVQAEILALLADLQQQMGLALLLISHDLEVVANLCRRVLVMYAGRVVESGPAARLLATPRHPYTAALLAARPRLDAPPGTVLRSIPGQPPDAARLPAGCAFQPRCAHAASACETQPQLLPQQVAERAAGQSGMASACHFPLNGGD